VPRGNLAAQALHDRSAILVANDLLWFGFARVSRRS